MATGQDFGYWRILEIYHNMREKPGAELGYKRMEVSRDNSLDTG
jgi:hypothetical protein